jgi:gluconokinase
MGVAGSGKTTIGILLAQKLSWQFADADDFHPQDNIQKINHGIPLNDADRAPWLAALCRAIEKWEREGKNVVLACSALKQSYREKLSGGSLQSTADGKRGVVRFIYLKGSYELILSRLQARYGHFATGSILKSQFEDLEEPGGAITVEVTRAPEEIVSEIVENLKRDGVS